MPKSIHIRRLPLFAATTLLAACSAPKKPVGEIARLRAQNPPAAHSLINPVKGQRFADTWGAARSGGRRHEGTDIFAAVGPPCAAPPTA